MRVQDLIYYLKLLEAPESFALLEEQVASQVRRIRSKSVPRYIRELWVDEAPRTLRYALFLRYYAAFENQLKMQCERCATDGNLALRLSDLSGDGTLDKVDKYLTKVANRAPLHEHPLWSDLLAYAWIRNRIMHDDGRIADHRNMPQYVTRQLKRKSVGFALSSGGVVRLNRPFCRRAVRCMARILYDVYSSSSSKGLKTQ